MNPVLIVLAAILAALAAHGHIPPGVTSMDVILPTGVG